MSEHEFFAKLLKDLRKSYAYNPNSSFCTQIDNQIEFNRFSNYCESKGVDIDVSFQGFQGNTLIYADIYGV